MSTQSGGSASRLTTVQWLVCIIAAIGFAFDIYELLMLPLIVRPALLELTGAQPGSEAFQTMVGQLFYIPAFVGGIFGLLGGYLTDWLGRRRVLTYSILLYAFSAFAAGFSTSFGMLLFFRCTTFVGVCIEFVAAVAWLAELFDDPKQRERVLGYTQAFSSVGGLLVAVMAGLAADYALNLPAIALPSWLNVFGGEISNAHAAWRYTLMSGLIPAIPLIIIRPFLPESPKWKQKHAAGTLRRPSIRELFAPSLRRTTVVTTLMFACSYGAAFGAIQMIPQIVPGLEDVRQSVQGEPVPMQRLIEQKVASEYVKMQEIGGLLGRVLLAILVVRIVSRRNLLRVFIIPGMFVLPLVFAFFLAIPNRTFFVINLEALYLGKLPVTSVTLWVMAAALLTVGQFSFWGNYLPRVYPLHLRGTGESFAANIGGRMVGTSFAWVTSMLVTAPFLPGETPPQRFAYAAAIVGGFVYFAGFLLSFWLPEPPKDESLDE